MVMGLEAVIVVSHVIYVSAVVIQKVLHEGFFDGGKFFERVNYYEFTTIWNIVNIYASLKWPLL